MSGISGQEWWRGACLYQIYPRSFLDTNGDGVGDLPGITERLDYIADLGVDGIWISPFFKSPMKDFGYDVADYCAIDPLFGTLDDFDRLVASAHRHGLKVIIDQVYSHTSDQHVWFNESRQNRNNPKSDWYVWADAKRDGSPPNNWQSVFGTPSWTWDARRQQYFLHNFLPEQPDLNLHNPVVQQALMKVARFWLDRGVDGFRLDAINFGMHDQQLRNNPAAPKSIRRETRPYLMQLPKYTVGHPNMPQFLEKLRAITDEYDTVMTVAEVGAVNPLPVMKDYTYGTNRLNSAYGFEFLSTDEIDARLVKEILKGWPGDAGEGWPSWAFSNHDAPRVASRWLQQVDHERRVRLIALLQFALRGNVFVYQGEELGLTQAHVPFEKIQDPEALTNWPHTLGRDGARTPMPWEPVSPGVGFTTGDETWLPVSEAHVEKAVAVQQADENSILQHFKSLIALRQSHVSLRRGDLQFLRARKNIVAFTRRYEGETTLCVFNLGDALISWRPAVGASAHVVAEVGAEVAADACPRHLPAFSGYIAVVS